jgi:hypothetical protein
MFTQFKEYLCNLFLGNVYKYINDFTAKMLSLELLILDLYKITEDLDFISYDLVKRNDLLEKRISDLEKYIKTNQTDCGLKDNKCKKASRFHPYNLRKLQQVKKNV